jgi:hypothetical protein
MMQGLLAEGDVPSVLKRTRGFDNPDFMASGPHDVLVDSSHARKARGLLEGTMIESEEEVREEYGDVARISREGATPPGRLALYVFTAFLGAVALVWVLYQIS